MTTQLQIGIDTSASTWPLLSRSMAFLAQIFKYQVPSSYSVISFLFLNNPRFTPIQLILMALTLHGIETMTLPGDQSLRDEPSRCLPSSSAYSSFFFTEPSVPASERHLYSPFFQAPPPLQPDPSPTPHLAPTYCYSNGDRSPMTTISSNETYGKALRTSHDSRYYAHHASPSLFTSYTEDFPRTDESLQPVDEAHHSAKYKNIHSGRDLKKMYDFTI